MVWVVSGCGGHFAFDSDDDDLCDIFNKLCGRMPLLSSIVVPKLFNDANRMTNSVPHLKSIYIGSRLDTKEMAIFLQDCIDNLPRLQSLKFSIHEKFLEFCNIEAFMVRALSVHQCL